MSQDVGNDHLALIRIEGMHCHKCERAIQNSLSKLPGVYEVEVDFASGQASVLFNRATVNAAQLTDAVAQAGYKVTGFAQRHADTASQA